MRSVDLRGVRPAGLPPGGRHRTPRTRPARGARACRGHRYRIRRRADDPGEVPNQALAAPPSRERVRGHRRGHRRRRHRVRARRRGVRHRERRALGLRLHGDRPLLPDPGRARGRTGGEPVHQLPHRGVRAAGPRTPAFRRDPVGAGGRRRRRHRGHRGREGHGRTRHRRGVHAGQARHGRGRRRGRHGRLFPGRLAGTPCGR